MILARVLLPLRRVLLLNRDEVYIMVANSAQRVMRRLTKAEGYLELGMPDQALSELQSIGDPGPYSVPHLLMTAAALKAQGKTDEASDSLRQIAQNLPKVSKADVWKVLGKFLKKLGRSVEPIDLEKILGAVGLKPLAVTEVTAVPLEVEAATPVSDDEIRVEIPNFGSFSVKVEAGQSVTIRIERPEADPKSQDDPEEEDDADEQRDVA